MQQEEWSIHTTLHTWKQSSFLKANTHQGFCSRDTLQEQSSSMCKNNFMVLIHSQEQNIHHVKFLATLNRLNIWEQDPGANRTNLKMLPRVYHNMKQAPILCSPVCVLIMQSMLLEQNPLWGSAFRHLLNSKTKTHFVIHLHHNTISNPKK